MKTTVNFHDNTNTKIAAMDIYVRLSPSGQTIVNEFNLDSNVDNQILAMTKGCKCPEVDDCKQRNNSGEWEFIVAEMGNGQTIAAKFQKDMTQYDSPECTEVCESVAEPDLSRSQEKLYTNVLKEMQEIHSIAAEKHRLTDDTVTSDSK